MCRHDRGHKRIRDTTVAEPPPSGVDVQRFFAGSPGSESNLLGSIFEGSTEEGSWMKLGVLPRPLPQKPSTQRRSYEDAIRCLKVQVFCFVRRLRSNMIWRTRPLQGAWCRHDGFRELFRVFQCPQPAPPSPETL